MTGDRPEGDEPPAPEPVADRYYRGVISRVYYGSDSGTLRSEATGREYRFKFPFVEIVGPIPRVDGLREGMAVGFDLGLSIGPLERLLRYFVAMLVLHVAVLALTLVVMALAPGAGTAAVAKLWHEHRSLLAARFLLGPLAALGLGYLIHRTLRIPQTMAATGLFYIAILAVMVGELLGRLILFRTSLPL